MVAHRAACTDAFRGWVPATEGCFGVGHGLHLEPHGDDMQHPISGQLSQGDRDSDGLGTASGRRASGGFR
jgi:hypothetical protein